MREFQPSRPCNPRQCATILVHKCTEAFGGGVKPIVTSSPFLLLRASAVDLEDSHLCESFTDFPRLCYRDPPVGIFSKPSGIRDIGEVVREKHVQELDLLRAETGHGPAPSRTQLRPPRYVRPSREFSLPLKCELWAG